MFLLVERRICKRTNNYRSGSGTLINLVAMGKKLVMPCFSVLVDSYQKSAQFSLAEKFEEKNQLAITVSTLVCLGSLGVIGAPRLRKDSPVFSGAIFLYFLLLHYPIWQLSPILRASCINLPIAFEGILLRLLSALTDKSIQIYFKKINLLLENINLAVQIHSNV